MPLIEYRCSRCAGVFERLVALPNAAGADQADCPDCGEHMAKRLISVFAQVRGGDGEMQRVNGGGCCGAGGCACGR